LAAVLEYLAAEILELAGNASRDNKKHRIVPRHIQLAVRNDEELNKLLHDVTIANGGVIDSCNALCSQLNSSTEATICDLVCSAVGIEAFVDLIDAIDPDPIYICEECDLCPINDYVKGNFISASVTPTSGRQGAKFTISATFQLLNTTGTGEIVIEITPPDGSFPIDFGGLLIAQPPGTYTERASFEADPDDDEPFSSGDYKVGIYICEGSCGSSHPHSYIITQGSTSFTITE